MDPLDFVAVAARARAFLEAACTALDVPGRDRSDATHPLDILRMHNLEEGATWDSIIAYREESGLPRLSPRTLRNRQNEAITLLLEWASRSGDDAQAVEAQSDAATISPSHEPRSLSWRLATILALALGLLALTLVLALRSSGSTALLTGADRQFLGKSLSARLVDPHKGETLLWRFTSPSKLPPLEGEYQQATISENGGRQYLYLGSGRGGADHTTVLKWDPQAREIRWKHQLDPPLKERWTHEGVLHEPMARVHYMVRWLSAGVSPEKETPSIVAVLWSRYSPTFVYFLDRDTGHEIGHYVHPGQLFRPIILDLDSDGRGETLLGGVDNPQESAVFVILKGSQGASAASDVLWNESGVEGASTRILFPDVPKLRTALGDPHWRVFGVTPEHYNANDHCLHLSVGNPAKGQSVYLADVYFEGSAVDSVQVRFTEGQQKLWASVGLGLTEAQDLIKPGIKILQSNAGPQTRVPSDLANTRP